MDTASSTRVSSGRYILAPEINDHPNEQLNINKRPKDDESDTGDLETENLSNRDDEDEEKGDAPASKSSKSPTTTGDQKLNDLTTLLRANLDIKDRKYLMSSYKQCFIGSEAVTYMVENDISPSRDDATYLGQLLLAADIIRHVTKDHDFKDENKFYVFTVDLPSHGAKEKKPDSEEVWNWSDYIPGMMQYLMSGDDEKYNLQPQMADLNDQVTMAKDWEDIAPEESFGVTPLDKHNKTLLDNVHPLKWVDPKPQPNYNMVAIGAGAAGLITAAGSAGLGGKVAIIDEHLFGGDCLNFGCVPSKAILRSARVAYDAIVRGKEFGLEVEGSIKMNFGKVMERVRRCRAEIAPHDSCERLAKMYGIDVFIGTAKFVSPDTVKVNGKDLKFSRCVIATGAKASVPPIEGLSEVRYLTNYTVWNLTERPERFGVIGSGPIGCELAQAFSLLGCKVTVLNRSNRILGKEDPDAADIVKKSMEECGVQFEVGLTFKSVHYVDPSVGFSSGIKVTVTRDGEDEEFIFDELLIATGRKPNVENLGLDLAKVDYSPQKGIVINDFLQTSNSNIYSAGDCCTRFQFTHMADAMARIVIRNALFFGRSKASALLIPWATFTFPEVAHVGLYEADTIERKIAYDVIKVDLGDNDRAICDDESRHNGFVKVLLKKGTDKILGATIVSENAGDQINEFTIMIQGNLGLEFVGSVIHPYPTVSEGIKHCGDAYARTKLTPITKTLLRRILAARR